MKPDIDIHISYDEIEQRIMRCYGAKIREVINREINRQLDERESEISLRLMLENKKAKAKVNTCDLHNKCGACIYYNYKISSTVGCYCDNPRKVFNSDIAHYKQKTAPACKYYKERKDIKLIYKYVRGSKK